jgi:dihydroorotate dehydrogenase
VAASDPSLEVRALGMTLASPLGVAAGMDKGASWFEGLGALGFGFVEVGTVTAVAQPGNPGTRVWRIPEERALLNSMGFPNPGAEAVASRLRRRSGQTAVGTNLGKSMIVGTDRAGADYRTSVRTLAPCSDYIVLNVSSPNTPGLRELQAVEPLRALVADVRAELREIGQAVPLLVKLGPDLGDAEIDAVADVALELGLDGLVAVNTTVERRELIPSDLDPAARGGISGAPLKERAAQVLRRIRARTGDELVLISVGGIETADDAWERILAGATLVQAYTGFVYGGPLWPRRINRGLARRVRDCGRSSIQELVGDRAAAADRSHSPI